MLLSTQELRDLTGYRGRWQQIVWLNEQGIPHKVDGRRILVLREHVTAWMENRPIRQYTEPNWEAVK